MQKKGTAGIHVVLSSNKNATICMFIMFNTSTNCPQLSQCFEHSWHSCPTATPFALAREQQSQLPKSWYDFRRCYERWDKGVEHPGALACSDFHRWISVPKLGCSELASSAKPSRQSSLSTNIDLSRWFWWHLSSIYSLPVQICFFQKPIDMPAWYGVTGRQESSASPDGPSGTEAAKWYANALACIFDFCLARDKPPCRSRSSTPKCRDLST